MPIAYQPPGVRVNETAATAFSASPTDPNNICIVGPSQGFQARSEVLLLDDNHPVTLSATNPDLTTLSLVDAANITSTPFQANTPLSNLDYVIDSSLIGVSGQVTIKRAMQTTIADSESVVAYYETNASPSLGTSFSDVVLLDHIVAAKPTHMAAGFQSGTLKVMKQGLAPVADYTLTGAGGPSPTIVWVNTAAVLSKFQTVYLDYVVGSVVYSDVAVQLNNLTPVSLTANAASIVVKTAADAPVTVTSSLYQKGTTTDLDYVLSGSGATTALARSAGTTSIGGSADRLVVRVSYQATPSDYWLPTICLSQTDVETKFGTAFDSSGNIASPVSLGASMAFSNGATTVVVQALFAPGTPNTQPTGSLSDWQNTLANLRDVEDLDVIVPLINTGGLTSTDGGNLLILQALQQHCHYMSANQHQLVFGIVGEDSTSGALANQTTLQAHSQSLRASAAAQNLVEVSPGAFTFTNPITGGTTPIGGQYAACCFAGLFGNFPTQIPFTRKRLNVITSVTDRRTEADKNADAAAGLTVLETKRGITQVRHAITTANDLVSNQELSVVRSKFWMVSNLQLAVDQQIVGQLIIDGNANFQVQLLVQSVLQRMVDVGAIVSYGAVQVRRDPVDPTGMQVQFSYLPAYPLNHVTISFSLNTTSGIAISTIATTATNAL